MAMTRVLDQPLQIISGSTLDLSSKRKTAKPAGSRGRIRVHASDPLSLVENDAPTVKIRMWVATWAPDASSVPLPTDKALITAAAEHLARRGFNAIRFHGVEYWLMAGTTGAFNFPSDKLDNLYWFMAECKRVGIYWIFTPRQNELWQDGQGSGRFSGMPVTSPDLKPRIFTEQWARDHYETGINLLYGVVNPYTGINMWHDPALFLYEGFNECSMSQTGQVAWPSSWQTRTMSRGTSAYTWPEWLLDPSMSHGYANLAAINAAWGTSYATIPTPTELPNQSLPGTRVSLDMLKYCTYMDDHLCRFFADVAQRAGCQSLISGLITFPSLIAIRNMGTNGSVNNWHDYPMINDGTFQAGSVFQNGAKNLPVWDWGTVMFASGAFTNGKPAYLGEHGWPHWSIHRNQFAFLAVYAAFHGAAGISFFHQGEFFEQNYSSGAKPRTRALYPYTSHSDPVGVFTEYVCALAYTYGMIREGSTEKHLVFSSAAYGEPSVPSRATRAFFKTFLPVSNYYGTVKTRVDFSSDSSDDTLTSVLYQQSWLTHLEQLAAANLIQSDNAGLLSARQNSGTITSVTKTGVIGSVTASATQPVLAIGSNTLVDGDHIAILSLTGTTGTWPGTSRQGSRAYVKQTGVAGSVQIVNDPSGNSSLDLTLATGTFSAGTWCEHGNVLESETGEIFMSRRHKIGYADGAQLFYFIDGGAQPSIYPCSTRSGVFQVNSLSQGAAFFCASLDGKSLSTTGRMLVGLVGNSMNTGEILNSDNTVVVNPGTYPILIDDATCVLRYNPSTPIPSADKISGDSLSLAGLATGSMSINAADTSAPVLTLQTGALGTVFFELRIDVESIVITPVEDIVTYTTNQNLMTRYGSSEILQIAGDGVTLDTSRVDIARLGAYNLINSHLGTKYALPLTVVVPILQDCEADIARYYLYDDNPTIHVKERFDYWTVWLADVSKGRIQLRDSSDLPVTKTGDAITGADGFFTITGAAKVFTEAVISQGNITEQSDLL